MLNSQESTPNISVDGGFESTACMLRLREPVVFPRLLASLSVEDQSGAAALDAAVKGDRLLAVFNAAPTQHELQQTDLHGGLPQFNDHGQSRCAVGTLVRWSSDVKRSLSVHSSMPIWRDGDPASPNQLRL